MDEFRQEGGRRPQRGFMDVVKENMQRVGEKDEDDPLWQPVKGAAERKRGSTLIPGLDLIITFLLPMLYFFLFAFKVSWCCGAGTRRIKFCWIPEGDIFLSVTRWTYSC